MSYVPTTQQQGQGGAQVGQAQVLPQLDFTGARVAVDSMNKAREAARLAEQKQEEAQAELNKKFGVLREAKYPPIFQGGYDNAIDKGLKQIEEDPRNAEVVVAWMEGLKKTYDQLSQDASNDVFDLLQKDVYFKTPAVAAFNDYASVRESGEVDPFKLSNQVYSALGQAVDVNKNLGKDIYDFSGRLAVELLNAEDAQNFFNSDVNIIKSGDFVGAQSVQKLSPEGREYLIEQIYSTPEIQQQLVGKFFSPDPTETERLAKDYILKNIGFEKVMGLSQASSGDRDRNNVGISISDGVGEVKNSFADAKRLGVASVRPKEIFMSPYLQEEIKVTADVNQDGQGESLTGKVVRLTANASGEPVVVVEVKKPYDPSNPSSASERINIEVPYEGVKDDILQNIREQYGEKRGKVIFDTISEWEGMIGDMEKTPFPEKELESTYNQLHKIATSSESDEKKTSQIQQLLGRSDVSYVGGFSTTDLNVSGKEVKLFKFGSKAKLSGEDLEETLSTLYDADAIIRGQESPTEPTNENKNYTEAEESGIKAVMESNGVTREEAIEALIEAGKISR